MGQDDEITEESGIAEWMTPEVVELDIRSTEMNMGAGTDGGTFPNTAS